MDKKTKFTAKEIENIKFEAVGKGYNPLTVDKTLDEIIEDYKIYDALLEKEHNEIEKLSTNLKKTKDELNALRIEFAKLKENYDALPREGLTEDNLTILKKLRAYEKVLHKRGINLKKALSDPDNC